MNENKKTQYQIVKEFVADYEDKLQPIVKEVQDDKGNTFPDYRMCQFMANTSAISLPTPNGMKEVPMTDGKISAEHQGKIKDFLLERGNNLEDFGPKDWTDEQQSRVTEIINYLTGKTSATASGTATNDDFSFDAVSEPTATVTESVSTDSTSTGGGDFDFDF